MKSHTLPLPLLLAALLGLRAAAQEVGPPPAEDAPTEATPPAPLWSQSLSLEELLQVELSTPAKQTQSSRDAPGTAAVVTRSQAQHFGWNSLEEVLFSQPGFFPSQDSERRVVGARGLWEGWGSNHLLVLVDGVPMNECDTGSALTWDITPLFFVKSVEIIRGPGSALYGSNATNGVVAINTLSAARLLDESEQLQVTSHVRLRLGNRDTLGVDGVAFTRSPYVSAVVGFQHQHTAGESYLSYDDSGRRDETGALQRFRVNEPRSSDYLFIKLEGQQALRGFSVQYHVQAWESTTGHGWMGWVPDFESPMRDRRHIAVLRYHSPREQAVRQEYVLKYQRREYDVNVRFYPNGALEGAYPAGVSEVLRSGVNEVFGRAQVSGAPAQGLTLLGGVEYTAFLYGGDEVHYANADLSDEAGGFPATPGWVSLGPFYEHVLNLPVHDVGAYAQLAWGGVLDWPLTLTAGLRYDTKFFHHRSLEHPGAPLHFMSYEQLSPRLALVYAPHPSLRLKLQGGQAFRAPTPGELFGANSWMTRSDLATLRPERVTTWEANVDWSLSSHLSWRTSVFDSVYENQLGYDGANEVMNLFSKQLAGVETELLADAELPGQGRLTASGSYTWVRQLEERDGEGRVVTGPGAPTWAPAHVARVGLGAQWPDFSLAVQARYQGTVRRREEDRVLPWAELRPEQVPAWVRVDANVRWRALPWATLGLRVTNLLDAETWLVRNGDYPYDYRMESRRVLASLEVDL